MKARRGSRASSPRATKIGGKAWFLALLSFVLYHVIFSKKIFGPEEISSKRRSDKASSSFRDAAYGGNRSEIFLNSILNDRFGCGNSVPNGLYKHPSNFVEVEVPLRETEVELHVFSPGGAGTDMIIKAIRDVGLQASALVAESCICRTCRWCNCLKHRVAHDYEAKNMKLKAAIFFLPDPIQAMASLFRRDYSQFQIDILSEQRCWQKYPSETLNNYNEWLSLPGSEDVFDWMGLLDRVLTPKTYETLVIKTDYFQNSTTDAAMIICSFLKDNGIHTTTSCIERISGIRSKRRSNYDPRILETTRRLYKALLQRIDDMPNFLRVVTKDKMSRPLLETEEKYRTVPIEEVRSPIQAWKLDYMSETVSSNWDNHCRIRALTYEIGHEDFLTAYGKIIVIEVAKSLLTRLLIISLGKLVAEKSNRTLYISWKLDSYCQSPMDAILDPTKNYEWRYASEPDADRFELYRWDHLVNREINIDSNKHLYISSNFLGKQDEWEILLWKNTTLVQMFQGIQPSKAIQNSIMRLNLDDDTVAVHSHSSVGLRLFVDRDYFDFHAKSDNFFDEMDTILVKNPKTVFVVSGDVSGGLEFKQKYGDSVMLLWNECDLGNRDTFCLQNAVVEVIALMQCRKFLGSRWSPFSHLVSHLGFQGKATKFLPAVQQGGRRTILIVASLPGVAKIFKKAYKDNAVRLIIPAPFGVQQMRNFLSKLSSREVNQLDIRVFHANLVDSYAELSRILHADKAMQTIIQNYNPILHTPGWRLREGEKTLAYLVDFEVMLCQLRGMNLVSFVEYRELLITDMHSTEALPWITMNGSNKFTSLALEKLRKQLRDSSVIYREAAMEETMHYLLRLHPMNITYLPSLARPFSGNKKMKIIGMSQVRNEEQRVQELVKMFNRYVDEVLLFDDNSSDKTSNIATELGASIIRKSDAFPNTQDEGWHEGRVYNFLLSWAVKRGATHVIFLDSDEIIMDSLSQNNLLRGLVSNLNPGEAMKLKILHAYEGHRNYIKSASYKQYEECPCFFALSGALFPWRAHHIPRVPEFESTKVYDLTMHSPWYAIVHFKFSNMEAFTVKTDWYKAIEAQQAGATNWSQPATPKHIQKKIQDIVEFYESKVPQDVVLDTLPEWTYANDQSPHRLYHQTSNWRMDELRYLITNFHHSVFSLLKLKRAYKPYLELPTKRPEDETSFETCNKTETGDKGFRCDIGRAAIWRLVESRPIDERAERKSSKPVIAVCIATTSKGVNLNYEEHNPNRRTEQNTVMDQFFLFSDSIPAVLKHTESDFETWIYVVYDNEDTILLSLKADVQTWFSKISHQNDVQLVYSSFNNTERAPGPAFNYALMAAYHDGADYLFRINDDTIVRSQFASRFASKLADMVPQNVGVVAPTCNFGNVRIFTHDAVHRTHIDIFGLYYPSQFTTWYMDDWITTVYGELNSQKLDNVMVEHVERYSQRYKEGRLEFDTMAQELVGGRRLAIEYCESRGWNVTNLRLSPVLFRKNKLLLEHGMDRQELNSANFNRTGLYEQTGFFLS